MMVKVKPATAKSYIGALRSIQQEQGYDITVFSDSRLDLLIRGGKRCFGEGEKRLRLPLTDDILMRVIHQAKDDFNDVNIKAAICVAFAAFLRSGEFTWDAWDNSSSSFALARRHIQFTPNGSVSLLLPVSKTDPFRNGVTIRLAPSPSSPLCPVRALQQLFQRFPSTPDHPLFSRLLGPFDRQSFISKTKEMLLNAGIPTNGFSGHSIHKGAAVSARRNGISIPDIKLMGRWKSDAAMVYINENEESQHIQRLLQLNHTLLSPNKSTPTPSLAVARPTLSPTPHCPHHC
jgi:hypothetical protein